jgi:CopG family transcriptional regulator/antitoxin EndoAI
MRTSKVTSLSLPPKLLREAERLARREGRTKSELFREALRRYLADSLWRELQEFGRSQSRKLALKESDVERLLQEYRILSPRMFVDSFASSQ